MPYLPLMPIFPFSLGLVSFSKVEIQGYRKQLKRWNFMKPKIVPMLQWSEYQILMEKIALPPSHADISIFSWTCVIFKS